MNKFILVSIVRLLLKIDKKYLSFPNAIFCTWFQISFLLTCVGVAIAGYGSGTPGYYGSLVYNFKETNY